MIDEPVRSNTAILAKEKGYKIWTDDAMLNGRIASTAYWRRNEVPVDRLIFIPTQASLQRWLRENFGIQITVGCYWVQGDIEQKDDEQWHYMVTVDSIENHATHSDYVEDKFITYELALEKGLQQGLQLIKNNNEKTTEL